MTARHWSGFLRSRAAYCVILVAMVSNESAESALVCVRHAYEEETRAEGGEGGGGSEETGWQENCHHRE